jgi:hypothetical protein
MVLLYLPIIIRHLNITSNNTVHAINSSEEILLALKKVVTPHYISALQELTHETPFKLLIVTELSSQ